MIAKSSTILRISKYRVILNKEIREIKNKIRIRKTKIKRKFKKENQK